MSKIVTTDMFIAKAESVHGHKYDYSKVEYKKAKIPVCIICPEHGEFWQAPDKHIHGRGCPHCARPNQNLTTESFIEKCRIIHQNKYDYSKTIYNGYNKYVTITCPIHGDFQIIASHHLKGSGCQKCGGSARITTIEFIERHKSIYGNKYDYSKTDLENRKNNRVCVICPEHGEYYKTPTGHFKSGCPRCKMSNYHLSTEEFKLKALKIHGSKYSYGNSIYRNTNTKICITCPKHGDFYVLPSNFLKGTGCKKCAVEAQVLYLRLEAASEFEEKARLIHGDEYDYSKVEYINARDKVCIICPIHGEFWQSPNTHLNGCGCPECGGSIQLTTEDFIKRAQEFHGDRYDYSESEYINNKTNVRVICREHGPFEISPTYHVKGGNCPKCTALKIESKQETDVRTILEKHSIQYVREKQFSWLRRGRVMPLDFFLPEYNIGIECQGIQHFKSHPYFGGTDGLKDVQDRDNIKKELCDEHGIRLLYYSDLNIKYPYNVIRDLRTLINTIKGEDIIPAPIQLEIDFQFDKQTSE